MQCNVRLVYGLEIRKPYKSVNSLLKDAFCHFEDELTCLPIFMMI